MKSINIIKPALLQLVDVGCLCDLSVQSVSTDSLSLSLYICIDHQIRLTRLLIRCYFHRSHLKANLGEERNCTIDLDYKRGSILSSLQILLFFPSCWYLDWKIG